MDSIHYCNHSKSKYFKSNLRYCYEIIGQLKFLVLYDEPASPEIRAPTGINAAVMSSTSIHVSWDPVTFRSGAENASKLVTNYGF